MVVAEAYAAGAGHVTVIWADDAVTRLTYEHVDKSYFEQTPEWKRLQLDSLAQDGACFVFIEGADPAALKGIDPAKPAAASKARNTQGLPPWTGLQHQPVVHRRRSGRGLGARGVPGRRR